LPGFRCSKTAECDSPRFQETCFDALPPAIVLAAVDFHDQPGLVVNKISNVTTDGHLAAELVPTHPTRAQYLPEPPLDLGHLLP
jgi:hypothetical protein